MLRAAAWIGMALLAGCAGTPERVLRPPGLGDAVVEVLPVANRGGWNLRRNPLRIGTYTASALDRADNGGAPRIDVGIGIGDHDVGTGIGYSRTDLDDEFRFQLAVQGTPLTAVTCRQTLDIIEWSGGLGERHGGEITVHATERHNATLNCSGTAIHPDWPNWSMALRARDWRPYFGVMTVDYESWVVASVQETTAGVSDRTAGLTVERDQLPVMLVDRLNDGEVVIAADLAPTERGVLIAAAAALLIARDPLRQ